MYEKRRAKNIGNKKEMTQREKIKKNIVTKVLSDEKTSSFFTRKHISTHWREEKDLEEKGSHDIRGATDFP